jgi:hypothetical protein
MAWDGDKYIADASALGIVSRNGFFAPSNFMEQRPSYHTIHQTINNFFTSSQADGQNPYLQDSASGFMLSQLNLVHILTYYFFKIRFNDTLPAIARSFKCLIPYRFTIQNSL